MKSRRRFLTVIAAASVGAACGDEETGSLGTGGFAAVGGAGGAAEPNLPTGYQLVGNVSGIPEGSLLEGQGVDMYFGRDANGLYAMTSRCTHQNCNMVMNDGIVMPGVIRCGCHGSEFDAVGNVTSGPANMPLVHFAVVVDENGYIGVNTDEVVDPSTRAPVA